MGDFFEVYAFGFCNASVCTDMSVEEATACLNMEHPTGISSKWRPSSDETFRTGEPNPCPCNRDPTRKHYLFNC